MTIGNGIERSSLFFWDQESGCWALEGQSSFEEDHGPSPYVQIYSFAPPAPCQGKSCCPCQAQGKRELTLRNPRSGTSPSGTSRCACRCHQQGGKPYQVLASRAVHPMGPFQGQNCINKEIVNIIYICSVNLSVVHCNLAAFAAKYPEFFSHFFKSTQGRKAQSRGFYFQISRNLSYLLTLSIR